MQEQNTLNRNQCCGTMTFWYRSGSRDLYFWLKDPDSIRIWIQLRIRLRILLFSSVTFKMASKNYFFLLQIFAYYYFKLHLHHCSKIKSHKKSQNCHNRGFYSIFAWWQKGSYPEPDLYLKWMNPDRGPDPEPDPYLKLMNPDPGCPKHTDNTEPDPDPQHF